MQEKTPPSKPSDLGFSEAVSSIFSDDVTKIAQESPLEKSSTAIGVVRALSTLGKEWVAWEPETIWASLKDSGVTVTELLKAKVQAVKTLLTTNAFWRDHLAFEKVVVSLNGGLPLFDQYQHPSSGMIARAIRQANEIRKAEFSDEVLKYIAAVAFEAGLLVLPEPLDIAQESLDEMTSPVVGRHLREEISRQWSDVNASSDGLYTETVTGIQLARMKAIQEYAGR